MNYSVPCVGIELLWQLKRVTWTCGSSCNRKGSWGRQWSSSLRREGRRWEETLDLLVIANQIWTPSPPSIKPHWWWLSTCWVLIEKRDLHVPLLWNVDLTLGCSLLEYWSMYCWVGRSDFSSITKERETKTFCITKFAASSAVPMPNGYPNTTWPHTVLKIRE